MIMETQNQQPSVNVYPNGGNSGFGDGSFGGGWFFWMILFFFMMFMGWGNNGYAGGNGNTEMIRSGFDQASVMNGINGIQTSMLMGFNNAEVSRCNQQANVLAAMNNQAMSLQNCCCENRAGIADVKYAIATEACADRAAVTNALTELTAQNNSNMNAMANMINNGIQAIKDQMCNDKIDAKNEKIADLERQLTMANLAASQGAQTAAILANNEAQTAALEQYLAPVPRPAYVVQNPNCCGQNYSPCGCRQFG